MSEKRRPVSSADIFFFLFGVGYAARLGQLMVDEHGFAGIFYAVWYALTWPFHLGWRVAEWMH